jgi:hypothetical protein
MRLTENQVQALEQIPGWEWTPTWEDKLEQVREFVTANNRLPRSNSRDETERRLAKWCAHQQEQRRRDREMQ